MDMGNYKGCYNEILKGTACGTKTAFNYNTRVFPVTVLEMSQTDCIFVCVRGLLQGACCRFHLYNIFQRVYGSIH